jgi:hypothetical protein
MRGCEIWEVLVDRAKRQSIRVWVGLIAGAESSLNILERNQDNKHTVTM